MRRLMRKWLERERELLRRERELLARERQLWQRESASPFSGSVSTQVITNLRTISEMLRDSRVNRMTLKPGDNRWRFYTTPINWMTVRIKF